MPGLRFLLFLAVNSAGFCFCSGGLPVFTVIVAHGRICGLWRAEGIVHFLCGVALHLTCHVRIYADGRLRRRMTEDGGQRFYVQPVFPVPWLRRHAADRGTGYDCIRRAPGYPTADCDSSSDYADASDRAATETPPFPSAFSRVTFPHVPVPGRSGAPERYGFFLSYSFFFEYVTKDRGLRGHPLKAEFGAPIYFSLKWKDNDRGIEA